MQILRYAYSMLILNQNLADPPGITEKIFRKSRKSRCNTVMWLEMYLEINLQHELEND